MTILSGFNGIGLLAANMCLPAVLFLCGKGKRGGAAGFFLEFGAYGMCMIRLISFIIEGIQKNDNSVILQLIRLLVTESMLVVFLLLAGTRKAEPGKHGPTQSLEYAVSMLFLIYMAWRERGEESIAESFCLCLGYLAVFLFLKCYGMTRERRACREELSGIQQLDRRQRETECIQNVDRQYQRTRELWHDLKNHIGVLQILAQEHKYRELTEYLVSFQKDVESRMIPLRTGCAAVDALLGDKLYRARRDGIRVSLQICDLSELTLDATDLCVVLGNLLDNCLEACARQEEPGSIEVKLKQQEGFYYLTLVNTAPEPVKEKDGFLTDKQDLENGVGHGLGLRSVERIAHQYGGSLVTDYQDGRFRVVVRMAG